ncbi:hypothetical protein PHIN109289_16640 [Phaeobacter inhibens]|uniref:Uncharacterized protein n=1 Tax=Phaeobacter gallaeciensis TaxID=60890 RepID=A0AAD0EBQ5_9RHOB|nr:hypothetical protein Gal_00444 [Phaeobacter gallaeciensis DSM 26640]ATE91503.1 hypothetical protein PhaeoP11_00441 [Phaeobacter gallaeciensis]ATE95779.1 hypothetical protein PhaeoP73_00442 [Phaeobacter gallaeciensis]ATF00119.1 hypothetical protein PhaeoP75_00442 [Phaeobacter gallaeciensis]ATF04551.1 hypothetical protein PhaeoP63_00442 [Phaeobacter gallaeciensis]
MSKSIQHEARKKRSFTISMFCNTLPMFLPTQAGQHES